MWAQITLNVALCRLRTREFRAAERDCTRVISQSAQELRDDDAIRENAQKVVRPEARTMIRETLEGIALAETIEPSEQRLLDWVDETWGLKS